MDCRFCNIEILEPFLEEELVLGFWDSYPLTPGHALLIPRRHVQTWFEATPAEQVALVKALDVVKGFIEREHQPDGYNIGVNSGEAAGQTVLHLHVHLIPRYLGDSDDPRGGVRNMIPDRAKYW
jgi:diadenosine tetraphosphate (Ap4A) HIT family hydrolase